MAKYIVLDSKFNPTSFKDMIAPYQEYFQKMDKMQEKNEELELATEQAKWMFDQAYAGEDTNPWLEYNKQLEEYADYASKPIDVQDYINKGTSLRKQYIRDIEKMNTAYKLYSADKEQRDKEILQDPTRVYNDQKDFNLRTYYDNLNHSVESVSGKHLASNIANKAKTKSGAYRSNITGNISGDPSSKLLIQHFGENPNDVLDVENAMIKWSQNPTEPIVFSGNNSKAKQDLANIIINEVKDYKDWKPESFQKLVRDAVVGIYDAIGQDKTQVIANKEYAEEQAYRKELLKALQEEYEGDTHQTTSLIFGNSNPVEDFSDFINDDGTYSFDNIKFDFNEGVGGKYIYNEGSPWYEVTLTSEERNNLIRDRKDKVKYSDIKIDSKIDKLLKNNLPTKTYNNLTVAQAEEWFNKLVNNQSDANLISLPYWKLESNSTINLFRSLGESAVLQEYTRYDYDKNSYIKEGDTLKIEDIINNSSSDTEENKNKSNAIILLGNQGELILNFDGKYYELPSNILSNESRAAYNYNFVIKDKTGKTINQKLKDLEDEIKKEIYMLSTYGEEVPLETYRSLKQVKDERKKLSVLLNSIGEELNTYTGTRNSNTN